MTPHSLDPNTDPDDPAQWHALCGCHQVMKKNYWDSGTGKLNIVGILQNVKGDQKRQALEFLLSFFGLEAKKR